MLEKGLIDKNQLHVALNEQEHNLKQLGEILISLGYVTSEELSEAITVQSSIERINLQNTYIDATTARFIPKEVAKKYTMIPIYEHEGTVYVAMSDPRNMYALDDLRLIIKKPNGIILVTGPTGSGKSTTLYALLQELNTPDLNIITIEDPVEYMLHGINQVQVNTKAGLTFASGLRSILRQDPDVVMVGEIRDEETAEIAVRASITGHLVLSTLHTNDAPSSIARLEDRNVQAFLVAESLSSVIAQRLVRRLCSECKKSTLTNPAEMEILQLDEPCKMFQPVGCPKCNDTGFSGRIAIHEVMHRWRFQS